MHILEPLSGLEPLAQPARQTHIGAEAPSGRSRVGGPLCWASTLTACCEASGPPRPAPDQRPLLGRLFESLMALNLRVLAQNARASVHHLRRRSGDREIDFIVRVTRRPCRGDRGEAGRVGVRTTTCATCAGSATLSAADLLDAAVITTGPYAYRRRDGIAVIPAALLGP